MRSPCVLLEAHSVLLPFLLGKNFERLIANNINLRLMSSKSNSNVSGANPTIFSRKVAKTGIRASAITLHSRSSSSSTSIGKAIASVVKGNSPLSSSSSSSPLSSSRNNSVQDENVSSSSKKSRTGPGPSRSSSTLAAGSTSSSTHTHAKHSSTSSAAATAYWVANNSRPHSPSNSWHTYKESPSLSAPSASNGMGYTYRDPCAEAYQKERDALFSISTMNVPDAHTSSGSASHKKQVLVASTSTENFPSFSDTDLTSTGTGTIKAKPSSSKKRKAVNMPLPIPFPSMEASSGAGVKTSEVLVHASPPSSTSPFSSSTSSNRATTATTKAIMKDGSVFSAEAEAQTPSPVTVPTILARYIPPLAFDKESDVFADQCLTSSRGRMSASEKVFSLPSTAHASSSSSSSLKEKGAEQVQSKIPPSCRFFG